MAMNVRALLVFALMILAAALALLATPAQETSSTAKLADLVPLNFATWTAEPESVTQVGVETQAGGATNDAVQPLYDEILMRTYRRTDGARVMLALAYGRTQRPERKIHRPELCYIAQGFTVKQLGNSAIALGSGSTILSRTIFARSESRLEPATYWIRIGRHLPQTAWETRWTILEEGLKGRIPDGILVRASSVVESVADAQTALAFQREFLADLYNAFPLDRRSMLAGV